MCCTRTCAAHSARRPRRRAPPGRLLGAAAADPRAGGRSDTDRAHAALLPGHLCRVLGRHPPHLRGQRGSAHPWLHRQSLFLQHPGRSLQRVRRPGPAHDRDELSSGRQGAVRAVRRPALRCGDARGPLARALGGRRAGDERRGCGRVLSGAPARVPPSHAAARRGLGLPDARAAEPDAVRRRGAAHQAGDRTGAAGRGEARSAHDSAHALRAR